MPHVHQRQLQALDGVQRSEEWMHQTDPVGDPGLLTADDLADQLSRTQLQVTSCVLGFGQVCGHGRFRRNHRAGRADRTLGQFQWLATVQETGYRVCEQSIRQNEVTADLQW